MVNLTANILNSISPFVLPLIMIILAATIGTICLVVAIKLIKRQVKLYNSISLVSLKSTKVFYYIFFFLTVLFIIYTVFQMVDPLSPENLLLASKLNMQRWQTNLALSFLIVLLSCVAFLLAALAMSKSAVVDRGIYTTLHFLNWYNVHDYIINEEKCLVILTSEKDTFLTLKGTTTPLHVAKNDIPKLKFMLNKNKNKFSSFSGDKKQESIIGKVKNENKN